MSCRCLKYKGKWLADLSDEEMLECYEYVINNLRVAPATIKKVVDELRERGLEEKILNEN